MLAHNADYGIALDGDGDRLVMVDSKGQVYDGDRLIYLIAKAKQKLGTLGGGVVGTVMTNMGMELALAERHIPFARAKVGDRYVLEQLSEKGWQLGGESSGHILCLDRHTTGDGIISCLQVLDGLRVLQQDMATILSDWQPFPQTLINVRLPEGFDYQPACASALAEAEQALVGRGRIVLRPSGTEPVVRVMVEAEDAELAKHWATRLAQVIEQASLL